MLLVIEGGATSRRLDLQSRDCWLALLRNSLRQVVHTRVPLSPSSIIWYCLRGSNAGLVESSDSLVVTKSLCVGCRSGIVLALALVIEYCNPTPRIWLKSPAG